MTRGCIAHDPVAHDPRSAVPGAFQNGTVVPAPSIVSQNETQEASQNETPDVQLSTIPEIIGQIRAGRPVILLDDESRENEGDLIVAAERITQDHIAFMAREGRGLICLALDGAIADRLDLRPLRVRGGERFGTAFLDSIEASQGVTTGISASDRARTIRVAVDPESGPGAISTPGHVFPLRAREGGVLARRGHTEAAVDLARLAGLVPAGVICEIVKDNGEMARLPDLAVFARRHGLALGRICDLVAFMKEENGEKRHA